MKFSSGVLVGAALGGYLIYNMSPQQRERVASTASGAVDKVRSSSVANSVSSNVSDVAGAASDRVAGVVDSAGDAVTDKVSRDDDKFGTTTV